MTKNNWKINKSCDYERLVIVRFDKEYGVATTNKSKRNKIQKIEKINQNVQF